MIDFKVGDRVEFAFHGDFEKYSSVNSSGDYDTGTVCSVEYASINVRWDSDGDITEPDVGCIRPLVEPQRRKHYDVIIAWANGAEIQTSLNGESWYDVDVPAFNSSAQYRIKPTLVKKSGWINIYPTSNDIFPATTGHVFYTKEAADEEASNSRIACVFVEWTEEQ